MRCWKSLRVVSDPVLRRSQAAGGNYHLNMTPQPWARTGPGTAKDGKPRFDLHRFDDGFFDRLRRRVISAGEAGIYVGVMLFDGWALHLSPAPDHIEGHPFHAGNNVNGISATSIDDLQVLPLDPRVRELQEAYLRRVVDTALRINHQSPLVQNHEFAQDTDRIA